MHNVHNVVMSSKAWANRPTSPHIGPFSFEKLMQASYKGSQT
jgi:hypothetical protein